MKINRKIYYLFPALFIFCNTSVDAAKLKEKLTKEDKETIAAVNQINGVRVDPDKFADEKKRGISLNPVGWLFKPVTDMQRRVIHLEQQIMRLEGPIAGLQKPMLSLRGDMVTVDHSMQDVNQRMQTVNQHMQTLDSNMHSIRSKLGSVETKMSHVENQLNRMYNPIVGLRDPVSRLEKPVAGVDGKLMKLEKELVELKQVVNVTSLLILAAVLGVGFLIALGTPIAALFAWKYRRTIMSKLEGKPSTVTAGATSFDS